MQRPGSTMHGNGPRPRLSPSMGVNAHEAAEMLQSNGSQMNLSIGWPGSKVEVRSGSVGDEKSVLVLLLAPLECAISMVV